MTFKADPLKDCTITANESRRDPQAVRIRFSPPVANDRLDEVEQMMYAAFRGQLCVARMDNSGMGMFVKVKGSGRGCYLHEVINFAVSGFQ